MRTKNILISGASIAGPVLAYWLKRYGFVPTIVEKAPALRKGGYKIDIRGRATEIVKKMGVYEEICCEHVDIRGASVVNDAGKRVAQMPADFIGIRQGDDVEVMRGDLADIFYRATAGDCEYIFGDSIRSMQEVEGGVEVELEHGGRRVFDLVIGADGLHSNVRSKVFGEESQFIRDLGGFYFSIFSVPNHLRLDRWELFYVNVDRVTNLYSVRDGKDAKVLFVFKAPGLAFDSRDLAQQKAILRTVFGGLKWEVPSLLSAMEWAPDFYLDAINQIKMPVWHKGRCMLLGDAAFAPSLASGQGTSMAIVGAYVLAGELYAAGGDHRVAFPAYECALRSFIEKNQKLGEHVKQMVPGSSIALRIQAMVVKLMPYLPFTDRIIKGIIERTYEAANGIVLKEY